MSQKDRESTHYELAARSVAEYLRRQRLRQAIKSLVRGRQDDDAQWINAYGPSGEKGFK